MDDLSDEQLMLMFKYGRVDAFDLLFEKYRRPLLAFIYQMVGDRAAAEDLFQDVFIQVVRSARRYEATARLSTWLYKIATNRCLNHLGSRGHRTRQNVISLHSDGVDPPALSPAPDEVAAGNELGVALGRVVRSLPEHQRTTFLLRETHGKPYREIAEILDMPMGTVKTNLHRARIAVREQMQRYLG